MRYYFLIVFLLLVGCSSQNQDTNSILESVGSLEEAVSAPVAAPDFSLDSLDGETYALKELRGKWVIVNFWATWCIPCRTEMPIFQSIHEKYDSELVVLAINDNETAEQVADYREELDLTFPLLLNPPQEVLSKYKVLGLPITVIIDPQGLLVFQQFGEVDLGEFEETVAEFVEATQ